MNDAVRLSREEAIRLCALDSEFFYQQFFPRTFRQLSPGFHREVDDLFDNPHLRYIALQMFRGSAKTTRMRGNLAKRISLGISRTIVVVGNTRATPPSPSAGSRGR